jgi:hypothetical protein
MLELLSSQLVPLEHDAEALYALNLLLQLAQLKSQQKMTIYELPIPAYDAQRFLSGKETLSDVMTDIYDYIKTGKIGTLNKEAENSEIPNDLVFTADLSTKDLIQDELNRLGYAASQAEDYKFKNRGAADYDSDSETAYSFLWAATARKEFLDGRYYIRNKEGHIVPALQNFIITDQNGKIRSHAIIDKRAESIDSNLYDQHGENRYNIREYTARYITLLGASTDMFIEGTPHIDDVTPENFAHRAQLFVNDLMEDAPLLTTLLVIKAKELIPQLALPDLRDEIIVKNIVYGEFVENQQAINPDAPEFQGLYKEFAEAKNTIKNAYKNLLINAPSHIIA